MRTGRPGRAPALAHRSGIGEPMHEWAIAGPSPVDAQIIDRAPAAGGGRMTGGTDPETVARAIVDGNLYMTLATADAAGRPWPTPVYFAPAGYREFIWVSSPEARHSRNIAARADVGIVVFDSRVPINSGQAIYMTATAELVPPADLDRCLDVFSRSNQDRGGPSWVLDDVRPPRRLRLYRATASAQWVLDEHDRRVPVRLGLTPA